MNQAKAVRFKLTHKNIRARYEAAKANNPRFSHAVMAEMFNTDRQRAYVWCRIITDEKGQEINDKRTGLPVGKKKIKMLAWLNDGVLAGILKGQGRAPIRSASILGKE